MNVDTRVQSITWQVAIAAQMLIHTYIHTYKHTYIHTYIILFRLLSVIVTFYSEFQTVITP